ncbi:MAG: hypothetical protein OXI26_07595 [bacterium]|nr:hypothetical protein [bacterium]
MSTDGDDVLPEPPALTLRWVIVVALTATACSITDSAASDPPPVERPGVSGETEDPAAVGAPGDPVDVDRPARPGPAVGPGTALDGGGVEGTPPRRADPTSTVLRQSRPRAIAYR